MHRGKGAGALLNHTREEVGWDGMAIDQVGNYFDLGKALMGLRIGGADMDIRATIARNARTFPKTLISPVKQKPAEHLISENL